jgi:hypothetical protein
MMIRDWRQLELFPGVGPGTSAPCDALLHTSRLYLLAHGPLTATGSFILSRNLMGDAPAPSGSGGSGLVRAANVVDAGDDVIAGSERWY